MSIYKSADSKSKTFKLWAKLLAIFLSIALVATMSPLSKVKSYADTGQVQVEDEATEESASRSDEASDSESAPPSEDGSYSESTSEADENLTSSNSDDADSVESQNSDSSETDSSLPPSEDAILSALFDSNSSDTDSEDSNPITTALSVAGFVVTCFVNFLITPKQIINEQLSSNPQEYSGTAMLSSAVLKTPLIENTYKFSEQTNDKEITDPSNKYDQYTIFGGSTQLNGKNYIDCNYSYHVTDDQRGVYIDGFSYINEEYLKTEDEKSIESSSDKTLWIPATLNLRKDNNTETSSQSLPVLGISKDAFKGQQIFTQIFFSDGKTDDLSYSDYLDIEDNAFDNCIALKKVASNRSTMFGKSCFANCELLESVYFERNVAQIQDRAFENCPNLNNVFWGNAYINQFTQAYEEYGVGDDFFTFGSNVFDGCASLESVCIPYSIKFVSKDAMANCKSLKQVVIGNSVEKLEDGFIKLNNPEDLSSIQKIIILNQDLEFSKDAISFSSQNENKQSDGSFYVYSKDGGTVMQECFDYKLPFSSDAETILEGISSYTQKETEDKGKDIVVQNDERQHKEILYEKGDGSRKYPYVINNFADLREFAARVNNGQVNACAILNHDISPSTDASGIPINSNNWEPIGKNDTYSGIFDGNNYTISGLTQKSFSDKEMAYMWGDIAAETAVASLITISVAAFTKNPLFIAMAAVVADAVTMVGGFFLRNVWRFEDKPGGFIYNAGDGCNIHNLDLAGIDFDVQTNNLGCLISKATGECTISSVTCEGKINISNSANNVYYGGLVGKIADGVTNFADCVNNVDVSSSSFTTRVAGGLVGGCSGNANIDNCSNKGKVIGNGADTGEIAYDVVFNAVFMMLDGITAYKVPQEIAHKDGKYWMTGKADYYDKNMGPHWNIYKERTVALDDFCNNYEAFRKWGLEHYKNRTGDPNIGSSVILSAFIPVQNLNNLYAENGLFKACYDQAFTTKLPSLAVDVTNLAPKNISQERIRELYTRISNLPSSQQDAMKKFIKEDLIDYASICELEGFSQLNGTWNTRTKTLNKPEYLLKGGGNEEQIIRWALDDKLGHYSDLVQKSNSSKYLGWDPRKRPEEFAYLLDRMDDIETTYNSDLWKSNLLNEFNYNKAIANRVEDKIWFLEPGQHLSYYCNRMSPERFYDLFPIKGLNNDQHWAFRIDVDNGDMFLRKYNQNSVTELAFSNPDQFDQILFDLRNQNKEDLADLLSDPVLCDNLKNEMKKVVDEKCAYIHGNNDVFSHDIVGEWEIVSPKDYSIGEYLRSWGIANPTEEDIQYALFVINLLDKQLLRQNVEMKLWNIDMNLLFRYYPTICHHLITIGKSVVAQNTRILSNTLWQQKRHKVNIDSVLSLGETTTNTTNVASDNQQLQVPNNNQYKQITSINNTNNNSTDELIKQMLKDVPASSIEGGMVDFESRRASVKTQTDAKTYYQQASAMYDKYVDNLYFNGLSKSSGFGTFQGVGAGYIGETTGSGNISFNNCTNESDVIGGETAGGFIGISNTSGETRFDKCALKQHSNICSVDTGKMLSKEHNSCEGGYIGLQKNGHTTFTSSTSEGQTLGRGNHRFSGYVAVVLGGAKPTFNGCGASGVCYSQDGGCGGSFVGYVENTNNVIIENCYADGLIMGRDTSEMGCISGTNHKGMHLSNVYYYADEDVVGDEEFVKSISPNSDYESNDSVTCMQDTKMLESGELCVRLNEGLEEPIFGQNLGVVPYLEKQGQGEEEQTVVKWKDVPKSERPLPFLAMPVFKYTETNNVVNAGGNTSGSTTSNSSTETSTVNSDAGSDNDSNSNNTVTQYINVPSLSVLGDSVRFIDVECDEHSICKPDGRIYVNNNSSYDIQMMATGSNVIKQVLLDNEDITSQLKFNNVTNAYEYRINNVTANKKLTITTEHKNFETKPEFENGFYLIKNINELAWYKEHYPSLIKDNQPANAKLIENIDLTFWKDIMGSDWDGLCSATCAYQSEFDGQGFSIKNLNSKSLFGITENCNIHDLIISSPSRTTSALIDVASGTTNIKNIKVEQASNVVSGLVQTVKGAITIEGCHVVDSQLSATADTLNCGGLIGETDNANSETKIVECYVNCSFSSVCKGTRMGGLIGRLINKEKGTIIDKCEVNIDASYTGTEDYYGAWIGGLIASGEYIVSWGGEDASEATITNSVISGSINNQNGYFAYGIGQCIKGKVDNCVINLSTLCGTLTNEHREQTYFSDADQTIDNCKVNCNPGLQLWTAKYVCPLYDSSKTWAEEAGNIRFEIMTGDEHNTITTGEAVYDLAQRCDMFVQKIDDPSLTISAMPTLNLQYKAHGPEYIIRFDGNGADNAADLMKSVFTTKGSTVNLSKCTYSKKDYGFRGWATSPSGKAEYLDEAEYKVKQDDTNNQVTLYAVWLPQNEIAQNQGGNAGGNASINAVPNFEQEEAANNENTEGKTEKIVGKVYKYKRLTSDEEYFSNLTDEDSYIVKPKSTNDNYTMPEIRVKSEYPATVSINAKQGYKIKDVKYDLKYKSSDGSLSEPQGKQKTFSPYLQLNDKSATGLFTNVYANGILELDAVTEIISGTKPQGTGTENDPYLIKTAEELLYLADIVNNGKTSEISDGYMYVKIAHNINMSNYGFVGLGTQSHPFKGSITAEYQTPSGESKTYEISGLDNKPIINYAEDSNFEKLVCVGGGCQGSIVAVHAKNSTFTNIVARGFATNNKEGHNICGGIVGLSDNCKIENCESSAQIAANGERTNPWMGGIVAWAENGTTISRCSNYSTLSSSVRDARMGGILGRAHQNGEVVIDNCVNYGSFEGEHCCAAGIVAIFVDSDGDDENDKPLKLEKCYNAADIEGAFYAAGGLIGQLDMSKNHRSPVRNYLGKVYIDKCSNSGNLSSSGCSGGLIGGIFGCDTIDITSSCSGSASLQSDTGSGTIVGVDDIGILTLRQTNTFVRNILGIDWIGRRDPNGEYVGSPKVMSDEETTNGTLCAELNKVSDDAFYQCIDKAGYIKDKAPRPIIDEKEAKDLPLYYITNETDPRTTESFYSNYSEDQLCWVKLDVKDYAISVDGSKTHYPINEELKVNINTKYGKFLDYVELCDNQNKSLMSYKPEKSSTVENVSYTFKQAGDYTLEINAKYPESQEPQFKDGWYLVSNEKELLWISQRVNGNKIWCLDEAYSNGNGELTDEEKAFNEENGLSAEPEGVDINFKLVADIDMTGQLFAPIGWTSYRFAGKFDATKNAETGETYKIKNINTTNTGLRGGLFGYVSGATITNCTLVNVNATGGGLAFYANGSEETNTVKNVKVSGKVAPVYYGFPVWDIYLPVPTVTSISSSIVGGVIGLADHANHVIDSCENNCSVHANGDTWYNTAGGIVGVTSVAVNSKITNCVNKAEVLATRNNPEQEETVSYEATYASAGGIVGSVASLTYPEENKDAVMTISKCKNEVHVAGNDCDAGGIVGSFFHPNHYGVLGIDLVHLSCKIEKCNNVANIGTSDFNTTCSGGLIGRISSKSELNCWNVTVDSCSTLGKVSSNSLINVNKTGGLIGCANFYNELVVSNSYICSDHISSNFNKENIGAYIGLNGINNGIPYERSLKSFKFENNYTNYYKDLGTQGSSSSISAEGKSFGTYNNDQLSSGELCYKLNNKDTSENALFRQNIDMNIRGVEADKYPISYRDSYVVYYGMGPDGINIFTNNPEQIIKWECEGEGTQESPYLIKNAANMTWLKNNPDKLNEAYLKLVADVDMSRASAFTSFDDCGIKSFDGDSHTIKGLKVSLCNRLISDSEFKNIKFVSCSCDDAIIAKQASCINISNCSVSSSVVKCNSWLHKETNTKVAGGLVAAMSAGSIAGCNIDIEFSDTPKSYADYAVGSFVGLACSSGEASISISDSNIRTFNSSSNAGSRVGFVGHNNGSLNVENCKNYCPVGGTGSDNSAGFVTLHTGWHLTIKNSENYGDIFATENCGGFIAKAECEKDKDNSIELINCVNYGSITQSLSITTKSDDNFGAGGLIGSSSNCTVNVTECANKGAVNALSNVSPVRCGGAIGYLMSDASSNRQYTLCVDKFANTGAIGDEKQNACNAGGIAGWVYSPGLNLLIFESSNNAKVCAYESAGGLVGNMNKADQIHIESCFVNTDQIICKTAEGKENRQGLLFGYLSDKEGVTGRVSLVNFYSLESSLKLIGDNAYGDDFTNNKVTKAQFASGEVTFKLNSLNPSEPAFKQNVDLPDPSIAKDSEPKLTGPVVYEKVNKEGKKIYTNDKYSALGMSITTESLKGEGTEASPYLIASAGDLVIFQRLYDDGQLDSACEVKVVADIDMSQVDWMPIGSSVPFNGVFTASYENQNSTVTHNAIYGLHDSLFANVEGESADEDGQAYIFGVHLNNSQFSGAAIAKSAKNATITSCEVATSTVAAENGTAAGFVANATGKVDIADSLNAANVGDASATCSAGFIGKAEAIYGSEEAELNLSNNSNEGAIYGENVGGILGEIIGVKDITLDHDYNQGAIYGYCADSLCGVGGIAGKMTDCSANIDTCLVKANIKGSATQQAGELVAGGLFGVVNSDENGKTANKNNFTLNKVGVLGSIEAANAIYGSGWIGQIDAANTEVSVENSHNNLNFIEANSSAGLFGNIASAKKVAVLNCYNKLSQYNSQDNANFAAVVNEDISDNAVSVDRFYTIDNGTAVLADASDKIVDNVEQTTVSESEFKSGALTHKLNYEYSDTNNVFYQNIDNGLEVQDVPSLLSGGIVFANSDANTYSNNENGIPTTAGDKTKKTDAQGTETSQQQAKCNIAFSVVGEGSAKLNGVASKTDEVTYLDVDANSQLTIDAQPKQGYSVDVIWANEARQPLNDSNHYVVSAGTVDSWVIVVFKEDTETEDVAAKDGKTAYKLTRENKDFIAWTPTKESQLPTTSGNYYLTSDVDLQQAWTIPAGVNISLSLDGHVIRQTKADTNVVEVSDNAQLDIYDLRPGDVEYYAQENANAKGPVGAWNILGSNKSMAAPKGITADKIIKGGMITGAHGNACCAIDISTKGACTLHQGYIVGNTGNEAVGGVNNYGTFTNLHGTICGNYSEYVGGVVNHANATFDNWYEVRQNYGRQICGGLRNLGITAARGAATFYDNLSQFDGNTGQILAGGVWAANDVSILAVPNKRSKVNDETGERMLAYKGTNIGDHSIAVNVDKHTTGGYLGKNVTQNYAKYNARSNSIEYTKWTVLQNDYQLTLKNGEIVVVAKM